MAAAPRGCGTPVAIGVFFICLSALSIVLSLSVSDSGVGASYKHYGNLGYGPASVLYPGISPGSSGKSPGTPSVPSSSLNNSTTGRLNSSASGTSAVVLTCVISNGTYSCWNQYGVLVCTGPWPETAYPSGDSCPPPVGALPPAGNNSSAPAQAGPVQAAEGHPPMIYTALFVAAVRQ